MPGFARRPVSRRRLPRRVLQLGVWLASLAPLAAQALATPDVAPPDSGNGLSRLWAALEKQLQRPKNALPLPWREALPPPATARLVWHPRSLAVRSGGVMFRVGIDPLTQWYFVAQVPAGGAQLRYFGPIVEAHPGVFVEAIGSTAAPARASAKMRARP